MAVHAKHSAATAKSRCDLKKYHQMTAAGTLLVDGPVELIDGEVVKAFPISPRHAACVNGLGKALHSKLRDVAQINTRHPIVLNDFTEPQPDIVLLKPRKDRSASAHPESAEVVLLIEIADSSIEYDRSVKLPLYARAEIPETWLVDLNQDVIESFSAPRDGHYRTSREFRRGEKISSATVPSLTLAANEILG